MANYIKTLKQNSDTLYPVTTAGAVIGEFSADKIQDGTITPDKFDLDSMPIGTLNVWSTSQITATTDAQKGSVTITTTKPVRLALLGYGMLKTSRYTSHISIRVDGVEKVNSGTNSTSFITVLGAGYTNLSAGTHTISYWLGGQDSGTTATLGAYYNNAVTWWVA